MRATPRPHTPHFTHGSSTRLMVERGPDLSNGADSMTSSFGRRSTMASSFIKSPRS